MAQGAASVVGFVLMPYAIRRLGHEAYGVYQLAQSSLSFFMLLELGMGPTLVRFCAQAIARNDRETIRKISSTGQAILGTLGLVAMVTMIAAIPFFLRFYSIPSGMRFDTAVLLGCMAVSLFLSMSFIVPQGIILGSNRYDLANGTEVVANLLRLVLTIGTFEVFGPSVLLLGACILATQAFRFVALFAFAMRQVGRAAIFSPHAVDRGAFRSMAGFSTLNVINSAAFAVVLQGPLLIVGKVMGPEMVTLFAPAVVVSTAMQGFLAQMSRPLVPLASRALADNDRARLGRLSMLTGRVSACVGLGIALTLCVFGNRAVGLWLGPTMAGIWPVVAIMALGTVISQTAGANYSVALGGGDIWPTVKSQVVLGIVVSAGVAVGTSVFAWNLVQVAAFIVTCQCIRNVFYLTYAYAAQFSYSTRPYIIYVYLKPLCLFLAVATAGVLMRQGIAPDSLVVLAAEVTGTLLLYAVLCWALLLPAEITASISRFIPLRRHPTASEA